MHLNNPGKSPPPLPCAAETQWGQSLPSAPSKLVLRYQHRWCSRGTTSFSGARTG